MVPTERRRSAVAAAPPRQRMSRIADRLASGRDATLALALLSVLSLGWIDYVTGSELAIANFYLVPIALVAWSSTAVRARLVTVLAAATLLWADYFAGPEQTHAFVAAWNTVTRLLVFVAVAELLAHLRGVAAHQQVAARTDHLTGVSNTRWFATQAEAALKASRSDRLPLSLIYLDLDDFKHVNDTLGHTGGDEVLRRVGNALRASVRATDVVGRLGGDEFALLLPATDSAGARVVLSALESRASGNLADLSVEVTFSAGAVTFESPPATVDEMVAAADRLMYETKLAGKRGRRHEALGAAPG